MLLLHSEQLLNHPYFSKSGWEGGYRKISGKVGGRHIKAYFFPEGMEKAVEEMKLRGFSPRSIKAYCYHIKDFMEYCNGEFSGARKRSYLLHLLERGKEPSSVRLASSAVDFYTLFVRHETPEEVPLPKKKNHMPDVLTKEQIKSMIQNTENIKHRLIIEILYSSGIRLSELLNLKVEDISLESNTIRVRDGKGAKDRLTLIGKNTSAKIRSLFDSGLILKGRKGKYSGKSVQLVISNAAKRAGIKQKVTPHMLRHSFATHLLESGVDIRYIQSLLGHERLATTQIYTRVAKNKLELIKSPLDD